MNDNKNGLIQVKEDGWMGFSEEQPCQPEENLVHPDSFTWIYILFKMDILVIFLIFFKNLCLKKHNSQRIFFSQTYIGEIIITTCMTAFVVSTTITMLMLQYLALVAVLPPLSLTVLPGAGGVAGQLPALQLFWTVTQTHLGLALNSGFRKILFLICMLTHC